MPGPYDRQRVLNDVLEPGVHVPGEAGFQASGRTGWGDQIVVEMHCIEEMTIRMLVRDRGAGPCAWLHISLFSGSLIDDCFLPFSVIHSLLAKMGKVRWQQRPHKQQQQHHRHPVVRRRRRTPSVEQRTTSTAAMKIKWFWNWLEFFPICKGNGIQQGCASYRADVT